MSRVLEVNVDDVGMGGVFSFVKNIIDNTSDINFDIVSIVPFENHNHIQGLERLGCRIYCVGNDTKIYNRLYYYYKRTKDILMREKYDCVHIHSDVSYILYCFAKAARDAGVEKVLLHSHAAGIDGRYRLLKGFFHKLYKRRLRDMAYLYLSCSDFATTWMFSNIPNEKIYLINNGIDVKKFKYNLSVRHEMRKKLNIEDSYVVGNVGRFAYQKNHRFMIDSFFFVKQRINNAKLLLVGEGILLKKCKKYAKKLGLEKDIIFFGTSSCVNMLMQAMDVFVLPSLFEGLPLVAVEAQAASLPTILSDKITEMAIINQNVKRLSIDKGCEKKWADAIVYYYGFLRTDCQNDMIYNKYNINDTIKVLKKMYLN